MADCTGVQDIKGKHALLGSLAEEIETQARSDVYL